MPRVGLFISWSGNSRGIAEALYEWLPTALHSIDPWMSEHDIHKGTRFLEEIDRALVKCQAGIICLTPENNQSVWVAFEAGALASRVTSSKLVIPLLSRMRPADVAGPLGMFQSSELTKPDMLRLIKSLNELNREEDRIPERRLMATFDGVWPDLDRKLPALESGQEGERKEIAKKSDSQILEEILEASKSARILLEDRLRDVMSAVAVAVDETSCADSSSAHEPMSSGAGLEGRVSYDTLTDRLLSASEIWLSGVSLLTILSQYGSTFLEYVERDRLLLRFLLLDPDDEVLVEAATRSLYGVTTGDGLRQDIYDAVNKIDELRSAAHDEKRVQLRYMVNLPSTSIIMTDPMGGTTGGKGKAIAEYYPYRTSSSDRPHIFLNKDSVAERKWFLFYREQFLAMWRDARVHEEPPRAT